MTTQTETTKEKQVPDFYIFENGPNGQKGGKPVGAAFAHKKGSGYSLLINGKRYAAFVPKAKTAEQPAQPEPSVQSEATEGEGA